MTSAALRRFAVIVITAVSVCYTMIGFGLYLAAADLAVTAGVLVVTAGTTVPHVLHVRAGLRGVRPRYLPLTLSVQALATYVPDFLLPFGWSGVIAPLFAGSLLVLLPLRVSGPLVGLVTVYQGLAIMNVTGGHWSISLFYAVTVLTTGAMIYALVRSARMAGELEQARAELAEAAVLKERLRISRDLHDGLGRSLTAIALKGDLAARLVERDPASARTEVTELVQVAREAVQDVRHVARGYREMSLKGETDRAVALLEASGVDCQVNLTAAALPRSSEEALAWGVREGVTNVLRHSRATTCSITTSVRAGAARLEVVNDRTTADPSDPATPRPGGEAAVTPGNGLTGLGERASQAGGTVTAETTATGGFRLTMEVPA
ncbi:sensor histidine kinase [Nonomuraea dietziae]|uniref:sensor histidine kinase n=1 Tax=Nonomuraea dietziae TaxID=65515 RepID=UPI0033CBBF52